MSLPLIEKIRESVRTALDQLASVGGYQTYTGEFSEGLARDLSQLHAGAGVLLTSSGTAALEIALRAANIGAGDEVLLSSYDYPGNFWAIERVGARPVLVDVAPNGWNIDLSVLEHALAEPNTIRGMVVSHLHGQLQAIANLRSFCDRRGLFLVEDTCQAVGAHVSGQPAGTTGHVGIASFGGGKVLSAGRGGCLFTQNEELLLRARLAAGAGSGPYAMSELQAAVVASQLKWLPEINATCTSYFQELIGKLHAMADPQLRHFSPASVPTQPDVSQPDVSQPDVSQPGVGQTEQTAFYQCGWLLAPSIPTSERDRFIEQLKQHGLAAGTGFPGFHRRSLRRCRIIHQQACNQAGHKEGDMHAIDQTDIVNQSLLPLGNAVRAAERTWVIHHRHALESDWQLDNVAALIEAATRRMAL